MHGFLDNYQLETDISDNIKMAISAFFIIISIIVFGSLMWADEFNIFIPILYILYILSTIYTVYRSHSDLCSPVFIFMFFSLIAFGVKFPILIHNPDQAFFSEGYRLSFFLNTSHITYAFGFFLVGYISFIIGFQLFNKGFSLKKLKTYRLPHPSAIALLSIILMIAYFILRALFHLGVPGFRATLPFSGYILFFFSYAIMLLLGFLLYRSLEINSVAYIVISFLLIGLQGFFDYLLGWKGGVAHFVLPSIIILYYMWKYQSYAFNKSVRNIVIVVISIFIIVSVFLFPIISEYRGEFVQSGQPDISNLVKAFEKSESTPFTGFASFLSRFSGIDNFSAVIAYFDNDLADSFTNDFFLFANKSFKASSVQFYTWNILGVSRETVSANAPTSWGILYMYGGIFLILVFFIIVGIICKYLYNTLIINIKDHRLLIIPYALFISSIFYNLIYEGNMLQAAKQFIALCFTFVIIIAFLNMLATGKRRGESV